MHSEILFLPTPFSYMATAIILLCLFVRRFDFYLMVCVLFSVFQAAAVFNVRIFAHYYIGVQPGYFFSALGLLVLMYKAWTERNYYVAKFGDGFPLYLPLLLLVAYALISLTFPFFFRGTLIVNPPRGGVSAENVALLKPSLTNFSQVVYLLFNVLFSILLSIEISRRVKLARAIVAAYLAGGMIVLAFSAMQFSSAFFSIPDLASVLYSNLGYSQLFFQSFEGIKRLNATFTEPSMLAFYLSGYYAFALWSYLATGVKRYQYVALLSGTFLILTTSTSGYVSFFVVSIVAVGVTTIISVASLKKILLLILLALGLGYAGLRVEAWAASHKEREPVSVGALMSSGLTNKLKSQSFYARHATDITSLRIIPSSYGLGAGLGSTRSSSLITNLLGNLGIPGLLISLYVVFQILIHVLRRSNSCRSNTYGWLCGGIAISIASSMIVGILSVPDITLMFVWIQFALLLGVLLPSEKRST